MRHNPIVVWSCEAGDEYEIRDVAPDGATIVVQNDEHRRSVPLYIEDPKACRALAAALLDAACRITDAQIEDSARKDGAA